MTGRPSSDEAPSGDLPGIPARGDIVGGKFVVERVLGVGGMGVVLAGRHVHLGQMVAIKFLRREAAKSPDAVSRFLREARSAVGLQSAHVVRVTDVGTHDDGLPYMVMEHLTGTDLGNVLAKRQTLPVEEAVGYVLQAMEAIAEAHAVGIVHRDLKPGNLFVTASPDGSPLVKVLDFGISKAADGQRADQQSLTATSAIMGSPLYMSPEQLRSTKNVDARTDIWALGVILYELIAGSPPFEAETMTGLCAKIVADAPAPLRARCAGLPPALEAVVMRCLEKDPARRPQSVSDLAQALRAFASPEGRMGIDRIVRIGGPARAPGPSGPDSRGERPPASSEPHVHTGFAETVPTWQTTGVQQRRRALTVAAVVGVGAIALVIGGVAAVKSMRGSRPTASAAAAGTAADSLSPPASIAPPAPSPPVTLAPAPSTLPSTLPSTTAIAVPSATSAVPKPSRPAPRPPKPPSSPDDLLLDRK